MFLYLVEDRVEFLGEPLASIGEMDEEEAIDHALKILATNGRSGEFEVIDARPEWLFGHTLKMGFLSKKGVEA